MWRLRVERFIVQKLVLIESGLSIRCDWLNHWLCGSITLYKGYKSLWVCEQQKFFWLCCFLLFFSVCFVFVLSLFCLCLDLLWFCVFILFHFCFSLFVLSLSLSLCFLNKPCIFRKFSCSRSDVQARLRS